MLKRAYDTITSTLFDMTSPTTTTYIYVYGDTEATTCKGRGGIYQHPPQNPDALGDRVRRVCKAAKVPNENMQEIIEVGFVFDGKVVDMFFSPRVNPKLDPFVEELCKISQDMLEGKPTFKDGFGDLCVALADVGVDVEDPRYLAVFCGKWDFEYPLTAHYLNDDINPPVFFQRVCDINVIFEEAMASGDYPAEAARHAAYLDEHTKAGRKRRTTKESVHHALQFEFEGQVHRADDDARNVAMVGKWLTDRGIELRPTFTVDMSKYD